MTSKRYHKLFQSYMARVMANGKGAGRVLRAARRADPLKSGVHRSYKEAWEALAPYASEYGIRKQ